MRFRLQDEITNEDTVLCPYYTTIEHIENRFNIS